MPPTKAGKTSAKSTGRQKSAAKVAKKSPAAKAAGVKAVAKKAAPRASAVPAKSVKPVAKKAAKKTPAAGAKAVAVKKPAAKKAAPRAGAVPAKAVKPARNAAKKPVVATKAVAVKKPAVKKAPAKKVAVKAAKSVVAKKAVVKKAPARAGAAKRPAAKAAPVKSAPVKKVATKATRQAVVKAAAAKKAPATKAAPAKAPPAPARKRSGARAVPAKSIAPGAKRVAGRVARVEARSPSRSARQPGLVLTRSLQRPKKKASESVALDPKNPRAQSAMAELRRIAEGQRGAMLSRQWKGWIGEQTKLLFQCERGHQFLSTPHNVMIGRWCAVCSHRAPITLEVIKANIARDELEGAPPADGEKVDPWPKLLTKTMPEGGQAAPLQWRCVHGHAFETSWQNMRARPPARRCLECVTIAKNEQMLAEKRSEVEAAGGKLLTTKWPGPAGRARFVCAKGHRWEARLRSTRPPSTDPDAPKRFGSWCPTCYINRVKGIE